MKTQRAYFPEDIIDIIPGKHGLVRDRFNIDIQQIAEDIPEMDMCEMIFPDSLFQLGKYGFLQQLITAADTDRMDAAVCKDHRIPRKIGPDVPDGYLGRRKLGDSGIKVFLQQC